MLFFIAELAPTLAFKLCAWCLGKTRDGIVHLVTTIATKTNNPASNERDHAHADEQLILDNDCVIIKRFEYEQLKQLHPHNSHNSHQLSVSEPESLVVDVSSSSPPSK
jgi:hypothetical protein